MMEFVERFKPEAAHFVAERGNRTGLFFFEMTNPQDVPSIAEPFFLNLNARIELTAAMNLEDMQAGVQKAMKSRWLIFGDVIGRRGWC